MVTNSLARALYRSWRSFMSCFATKKLDMMRRVAIMRNMRNKANITGSGNRSTTETIRNRIEAGGERVWRFEDFDGLPSTAVAQTLSRLAKQGMVQRLGKGIYYRPRQTAFGMSKPNLAQVRLLPLARRRILPGGNRGGESPRLYHPKPWPRRGCHRRDEFAPDDCRPGHGRPYPATRVLAEPFGTRSCLS